MLVDYYSTLTIDFGLIAPELVLAIGASILLLVASVKRIATHTFSLSLLVCAVSFCFTVNQWGNQGSGFADMVSSDNFGIMFKGIFLVALFITILLSRNYLQVKGLEKPEYYILLIFSTLGMMVMANSSDLIVMFLGLEIMSVPLYILAGYNRRSLESNEAGIKYFLMGAFASAFLLMGIVFIFGAAETTNLRRIVTDFSYIVDHHQFAAFLYVGIALTLIGFAFKVAAVPFHSWVPDVYQGAPTPITAFFSVAPKAAGFAVMLRLFVYGFSEVEALSTLFWVLAVLTMSVGNFLALRQNNVKRMLAYSSISHAGYLLVALAVGGPESVSAAIFYLASYTTFNLGAFGILVMIDTKAGSNTDYSDLAGISKTHPYLSVLLALFMFALAGFPPTVGFFGKFYLFSAAVRSGFIWLTVIGVMNSFVSVYFYLRVIKSAYFDNVEKSFTALPLSSSAIFAVVVLALGTFGLGIFPQQLLELSQAAIFGLP